MANTLLPPEERNLTPDQVEALDKRRDLGHTFLVIAGQFSVIATVLLLWVGQDLQYSPGWAHPMAYYFFLALAIIVVLRNHRTGSAQRHAAHRLSPRAPSQASRGCTASRGTIVLHPCRAKRYSLEVADGCCFPIRSSHGDSRFTADR